MTHEPTSEEGHDTETTLSGAFAVGGESPVSLVLYHENGARLVSLSKGAVVTVGRSPTADVSVQDRSLTRRHAQFSLDDDGVWIEDLGSTNGTRLNGRKISRRTHFGAGDELRLGSVGVLLYQPREGPWRLRSVDSYDAFSAFLDEDVTRAKISGGRVSLLMVRQARAKRKGASIATWCPAIQEALRPKDRIGMYGRKAVLVSLPDTDAPQASAIAEQLLAAAEGPTPLLCGVAIYPDNATSVDELVEAVREAAQDATTRRPLVIAEPRGDDRVKEPIVASDVMRDVYRLSDRVVNSSLPVLILGETGTGKEVLARSIHRQSRRSGAMCCVNCAAIAPTLVESTLFGHERGAFTGAEQRANGVFEEADGGTVLLDELGELSLEAQATLLRVLETSRIMRVGSAKEIAVDTRVIASTNRDLEAMCDSGLFRWDLFYRLNMFTVVIPPLRERREEIVPLAEHFLKHAARVNRCPARELAPLTKKLLEQYSWPGNVRELRNVIERAVLITESIEIAADDLSQRVRREGVWRESAPSAQADATEISGNLKDEVERFEARLIARALAENHGNQTNTAKALGLPLRTLIYKMKKHGLKSGGRTKK